MKYKLSNTSTFRQITGVYEAEIITRFNNALRMFKIEIDPNDVGQELGVALYHLGYCVEGYLAAMFPEDEITCSNLTELIDCKIELI